MNFVVVSSVSIKRVDCSKYFSRETQEVLIIPWENVPLDVQPVKTQISFLGLEKSGYKVTILRHLIWVYTACKGYLSQYSGYYDMYIFISGANSLQPLLSDKFTNNLNISQVTIFLHFFLSTLKERLRGPVVQSIVSLMMALMTNSLTIVSKVFSNTLIFLLQKCE